MAGRAPMSQIRSRKASESIAFVSYDPHGNREKMFKHDWRHWQFMSL
ncbi:MAG: hypothetical protein ABF788_09355 [Zymomonas mobilis]